MNAVSELKRAAGLLSSRKKLSASCLVVILAATAGLAIHAQQPQPNALTPPKAQPAPTVPQMSSITTDIPSPAEPAAKPQPVVTIQPATKSQPIPCPVPGVAAKNCAAALAAQKAPASTGELDLDYNYFELYEGEHVSQAFTARTANAAAISLPQNAWSSNPHPATISYFFTGPPPAPAEKRAAWTMDLHAHAAPGTYTITVQASDGPTVYQAPIVIVILADPES